MNTWPQKCINHIFSCGWLIMTGQFAEMIWSKKKLMSPKHLLSGMLPYQAELAKSNFRSKGQLISKCPFGVCKLTKKRTKFL